MRHLYALWAMVLLLGASSLFALVQVENLLSHQNDTLDALICHAQKQTAKAHYISAVQREHALRFYEQQIRVEHLKPCG